MKAAVFLLSAALLAHEVALLRVLAIATWSHAASLVVSVALLGFGAAGTLLAVAPRVLLQGPATAPGKTILETWHGLLGRVDHVQLPSLHFAPGLSLLSPALSPPQEALFVDGHPVAALDRGASSYLDHSLAALPRQLLDELRLLLLGVGPGLARADHVVDADRNLLSLAEGEVVSPLSFLERETRSWDLIQMHVGELDPVHETPLLTRHGLSLALSPATPAGALAVSTRLSAPPRAGPKLLATARQVSLHVIAARSMDRLCVVMCRRAPTAEQLERVQAFCLRHGFDLVLPLEVRPEDPVHAREVPLLQLPADYPYDLRPATRARPYFHRFFRWSRLGDLLDPQVIAFVRWPFVSLVVALLQVLVLTLVLLLGPLVVSRAERTPPALFLTLGLAFMAVEMSFLARATLLLGSPALAASAVIGGFMGGSGLGSAWGERLGHPLSRSALAAATLGLPAFLVMGASPLGCAAAAILVSVPMGMPFPAALGHLARPSVT